MYGQQAVSVNEFLSKEWDKVCTEPHRSLALVKGSLPDSLSNRVTSEQTISAKDKTMQLYSYISLESKSRLCKQIGLSNSRDF